MKMVLSCNDIETLYQVEYNFNKKNIQIESAKLFEDRKLDVGTDDFDVFTQRVMFDSKQRMPISEVLDNIRNMKNGQLFDQDFLDSTYQTVVNVRDLVSYEISDASLEKLWQYSATSMSSSGVGQAEFALVLLAQGAQKAVGGGDINYRGMHIEVKGNQSKMASQNTHIPLSAIRPACVEYIKMHIGKTVDKFPNISKKQIQTFYFPLFEFDGKKTLAFFRFVFRSSMPDALDSDFDWMDDDRLIVKNSDGSEEIDVDKFFELAFISEFTFYKRCDKFDRILFFDPNSLRIYNTDVMNETEVKKFRIYGGYPFYSERVNPLTVKLR